MVLRLAGGVMCGRMNISDFEGIREFMEDMGVPVYPGNFRSSYNVAPGAVVTGISGHDGELQLTPMKWGITPAWSKPDKPARPLINARAETIHEKASFKRLIESCRTIVPANGFYEWLRAGKSKIPYYITGGEDKPLLFAAIYKETSDLPECTILTREANQQMQIVHHRMPVVLDSDHMLAWLQGENRQQLDKLIEQASAVKFHIDQVSSYVNNARNDGPQCIELAAG